MSGPSSKRDRDEDDDPDYLLKLADEIECGFVTHATALASSDRSDAEAHAGTTMSR